MSPGASEEVQESQADRQFVKIRQFAHTDMQENPVLSVQNNTHLDALNGHATEILLALAL